MGLIQPGFSTFLLGLENVFKNAAVVLNAYRDLEVNYEIIVIDSGLILLFLFAIAQKIIKVLVIKNTKAGEIYILNYEILISMVEGNH